jgi:hypothetical protein
MHSSALATSRPAAFLPAKQAVRQARRNSVKVMANFHSLSAKTLDGEAVHKQALVCPSWLQLLQCTPGGVVVFAHPLAGKWLHAPSSWKLHG